MIAISQSLPEWLPLSVLAGLPGLPTAVDKLRDKANKENWPAKKREGKGGGRLYRVDSLPAETRLYMLQQVMPAQPDEPQIRIEQQSKAKPSRADNAAAWAAMAEDNPKKLRAMARLHVCEGVAEHCAQTGLGIAAALTDYAARVSTGQIAIPAEVALYLPKSSLKEPTLRLWYYTWRSGGPYALCDDYGKRKGQGAIETSPQLRETVLGLMLKKPHIRPRQVVEFLRATGQGDIAPSETSVRRFQNNFKSEYAQVWTRMTDPGRYKNKYQVAFGSHHENVTELNQLWELDSTPGDWMLTDGRHTVVGCIDLYSRQVQLVVSKTSTAAAVCQVLRRSLIAWGVPQKVRVDNGADYASEQFLGALSDLEIEHQACLPFASEQKGTIERFFRTMSHGVLELLPGFIGHNVAERKVIEDRKAFAQRMIMTKNEVLEVGISSTQLQEILDKWTKGYNHTFHSGLKDTPFNVYVAWRKPIPRITNERALDALLAPLAAARTITKQGIRYEHRVYKAPELEEYIGCEARLRHDEQDIGKLVVYVDSVFVCVAQCLEVLNISPAEMAMATRAKQKSRVSDQAKEMTKLKKEIQQDPAAVILEYRISQSENITALPHRSTEYTTDALREAERAVNSGIPHSNLTPEQLAEHRHRAAEIIKLHQESEPTPETARSTFLRWRELDQEIASGKEVSDEQRAWHRSYQSSAGYRGSLKTDALYAQKYG